MKFLPLIRLNSLWADHKLILALSVFLREKVAILPGRDDAGLGDW